jgi:hypothetical protein
MSIAQMNVLIFLTSGRLYNKAFEFVSFAHLIAFPLRSKAAAQRGH